MRHVTREELNIILEKHKLWLSGDYGGERADLSETDLSGVNLGEVNLRGADLSRANLVKAKLGEVNLSGANLRGADLSLAELCGANLRETNLRGADLREANLIVANLSEVNLRRADLSGAKNVPFIPMACPEKGSFIGFKKVRDNYIVELEILEDALRCSATTRKCRCSKARVVSITNIDRSDAGVVSAVRKRDGDFV